MERDLERERQEEQERKSRIDVARDNLYKPGGPTVIHKHNDPGHLPEEEAELPTQAWTPPPVARTFDKAKLAGKANTLFRRLFIIALIFFVVSLGVATFMYIYGNTTISARNIDIEITAPPSVPSSDTFSFDVTVQNGNNSDLVDTAIVIDYPDGARYVDDSARPLLSDRVEIGTLGKGQIVKKTISARLFGQEGAEKNIKVRLEYQVKDSNGHFSKETDFDVILRLAPLVLTIDALKEVNNNQEVTLTAKVISNSNNTLNNVVLNVEYPFGFAYTSSNLEVDGKRGEFPLGQLMPNETKTVMIKGLINGQSAEDKVFKFNVGTANDGASTKATTILANFIHSMVIRGDFLATSIVFNDRTNYAVIGSPIRGTITWKNTLPDPINDAKFTLEIDGDLIDLDNIVSDRGFYDSNKAVIEWNKNVDPGLEEIGPGESGSFNFTIGLLSKEEAINKRLTNPKIHLNFDVHGRRLTDRDVTEDIESSFTRLVPLVTSVDLNGKGLYATGPIKNSGPIPPKSETKTTYTIALSLSNTVNEVTEGDVTATLPNYVKYEGEISPSSEKVIWNESSRQLRWRVDSLPVRTGYGSNPRTLYFKVSVTPSRTQIGQVLQLVNNISFTGKDAFADATVKANSTTVTTALQESDVGFGNGQVVQ